MDRFAYAQDVFKNADSSFAAGFNRCVGGQSYADAFQYDNERQNRDMVAGFYQAEDMIRDGKVFFVHNFHKLECPNGHAFQYGGTYACNTCNRDHLDKEWWKIKVQKDGSAWCCVGNGFLNLQESENFAFGDTREQAIQAYGELMSKLSVVSA